MVRFAGFLGGARAGADHCRGGGYGNAGGEIVIERPGAADGEIRSAERCAIGSGDADWARYGASGDCGNYLGRRIDGENGGADAAEPDGARACEVGAVDGDATSNAAAAWTEAGDDRQVVGEGPIQNQIPGGCPVSVHRDPVGVCGDGI